MASLVFCILCTLLKNTTRVLQSTKSNSIFQLDSNSVGLFRILLGISVFYNIVFIRFSFAKDYWGANRVIPDEIFYRLNNGGDISIFNFIHSDFFAQFFFLASAILAVLFTLGLFTKWITPVLTFMVWNFLQSSFAFSFGFDQYMFAMLFLANFLPLENTFSVSRNPDIRPIQSWVVFVVLVQIVLIYFLTGWAKTGDSWTGGYAIRNMLLDEWAVRNGGRKLAEISAFYMPATYLSLLVECCFPLIVFFPYKNYLFRFIASVFLFVFHAIILLTYDVGNFSLTGFAVAAILLPTEFWAKLSFIKHTTIVTEKVAKKVVPVYNKAFFICYLVVVFNKSFFFFIRNSLIHHQPSVLEHLEIPTVFKIGFFNQTWKMFAPDPPVKVGWLAIEEVLLNGTVIDFYTRTPILKTDISNNWQPRGLERYIFLYARNFNVPGKNNDKFKVFLKYYLLSLNNQKHFNVDYSRLYLTDYIKIVVRNRQPKAIVYEMYPAVQIIKTTINKYEKN